MLFILGLICGSIGSILILFMICSLLIGDDKDE
jgi:hypothetical protein